MSIFPTRIRKQASRKVADGSVLLYVLWILAVISVLAFQMTASSHTTTLNQTALANKLKRQLQLESALQFAQYRILLNQWNDRRFQLELNGQRMKISIFNEAGFASIYDPDDDVAANMLEAIGLDRAAISRLREALTRPDDPRLFRSYDELGQFLGLSEMQAEKLTDWFSIYHDGAVDPRYSPPEVLMHFPQVDPYRIQRLIDSTDDQEKSELRQELAEILGRSDLKQAVGPSSYYRVLIDLGSRQHRIFLKTNGKADEFVVVLSNSRRATRDDDFGDTGKEMASLLEPAGYSGLTGSSDP